MPRLLNNAVKKQQVYLDEHDQWTISLDGMTDCSGNSIVAVMLIDGRTKHYILNLDLGMDEHPADNNLFDALIKLLGDRINS